MNVSVSPHISSRGKNWELLHQGGIGGNIVVNRNSFSWKLSLLHNVIAQHRAELLNNLDFETVFMSINNKKVCRYIRPTKTRNYLREWFNTLKEGLRVNDLSSQSNQKLRYVWDERELTYPARTIAREIERNDEDFIDLC